MLVCSFSGSRYEVNKWWPCAIKSLIVHSEVDSTVL